MLLWVTSFSRRLPEVNQPTKVGIAQKNANWSEKILRLPVEVNVDDDVTAHQQLPPIDLPR